MSMDEKDGPVMNKQLFRRQKVRVKGRFSQWEEFTSESQRTELGPILFTTAMKDTEKA